MSYSPPKAWFYLKKRQALRRGGMVAADPGTPSTVPFDFALSPSTSTDNAAIGSTVGALAATNGATRPNDYTLTGATTTDGAAIGTTVGTLG